MRKSLPEPGDVVAGKYRIDKVLGKGGMGIVCAATHQLTGKRVALKWMLTGLAEHDGAVERFLREARAAGRIDSPHVVDIYDVGQDGESLFLVMELLEGEPLSQLLARGDTLLPELLRILCGAMHGVAAAHAEGVVHRDLKPDNVFVCKPSARSSERVAKILDFGISKLSAAEGKDAAKLTSTGTTLGTPYYMSPEQARGDRDLDHRADVYAFGVILYEAVTGRVPFDGDNYNALILRIVTEAPPRPRELRPELTPELEAVVLRAMARDRNERFQDMEAFVGAVEGLRRASEVARAAAFDETRIAPQSPVARASTTPMTAEAIARALPRRRWGVLGGSVVSLLAIGVGIILWPRSGPDDTRAPAVELAAPATPATSDVPAVPAPGLAPSAPAPALAVPPVQAATDRLDGGVEPRVVEGEGRVERATPPTAERAPTGVRTRTSRKKSLTSPTRTPLGEARGGPIDRGDF